MYAYVNSLPRGEQGKAMNALRQYVYGPGKMQPDDAIERYKEQMLNIGLGQPRPTIRQLY